MTCRVSLYYYRRLEVLEILEHILLIIRISHDILGVLIHEWVLPVHAPCLEPRHVVEDGQKVVASVFILHGGGHVLSSQVEHLCVV